MKGLVICAKSTWDPAIRREHALARVAGAAGIPVWFIERPLDVRALRTAAGARAWIGGLAPGVRGARAVAPGVRVLPSSVLAPGHRDDLAERTQTRLLARRLRAIPGVADAVVLAQVPWQWPALAAAPAARRVFDSADDWSRQVPGRAARFAQLLAQIDAEADAVVLVDGALADRFATAAPVVVRNGVADELLAPLTPAPDERTMVWAGTLSERFDAPLAGQILDAAPQWRLELYGQAQYAGAGDGPGPELTALLAAHPDRVRWHGVIPRARLAAAIDSGAAAVILVRPELTPGQDSMKLYDYAARGRPIIATPFGGALAPGAPPELRIAATGPEFAAALEATRAEPPEATAARRAWAEQQRWEARWPAWHAALFGATEPGGGAPS